MKALSILQPWASLIALGEKTWETRSWAAPASLDGARIAIHASQRFPRECRDIACTWAFRDAWTAHGITSLTDLPRGAVLATATLVSSWFILGVPEKDQRSFNLTKYDFAYGDWSCGRYAWKLADIEMLPEPIPAKGALGLWNWDGLAA